MRLRPYPTPTVLLGAATATLVLGVSCASSSSVADSDRTAADASVIEIAYATGDTAASVTKDVTLPTKGAAAGSAIAWTSSNPVALSPAGKVVRPPVGGDGAVTLTAQVTLGASVTTRTFTVNVKPVDTVQFLFSSDCHFGDVTSVSAAFQGATTPVDAVEVNGRARDAMNLLPGVAAPGDYGVNAGVAFGNFDFLAFTGDVASRSVLPPESNGNSSAASFNQWKTIYSDGLTLKDRKGAALPIFLTPGNHDVTNALGGPEVMNPASDPTCFVNIYNWTMKPATPLLTTEFNYNLHKVFNVKVFGGIHFVFLNMWLDAEMQEKLEAYLTNVPTSSPVFIFAHMPPEQTGANFRDPLSNGLDFPWAGGFANYFRDAMDISNVVAPATAVTTATAPTKEVKALATFLKAHKNIVAWFHGHDNFNQFRTWNGENSVTVDNKMTQLAIPVFRVDSPMKGKDSAKDPKKLSFQVVTIDTAKKLFTVRECLWNKTNTAGGAIAWGATETFPLGNRVR